MPGVIPAGRDSPGTIRSGKPFASPLMKRIKSSRAPRQLPRGARPPAARSKDRIEHAKNVLASAVTIAGTTQTLLKSTASFRTGKQKQRARRRSSIKDSLAFGHHDSKSKLKSRHDLGAIAAEANKGKGNSGLLGTKRKSASTSAKVALRRRSISHMGRVKSGVNLLEALQEEAAKDGGESAGQMSEPEPSVSSKEKRGLSRFNSGKRRSIVSETQVPVGSHRRFRRKSSMVIVKAAQASRQQLLKRLGRFLYVPSRAAAQLTTSN